MFVKQAQAHKICTEAMQWPWLTDYWIKFKSRNLNFSKHCKDEQLAQKHLRVYKHWQSWPMGLAARGFMGPGFRAA